RLVFVFYGHPEAFQPRPESPRHPRRIPLVARGQSCQADHDAPDALALHHRADRGKGSLRRDDLQRNGIPPLWIRDREAHARLARVDAQPAHQERRITVGLVARGLVGRRERHRRGLLGAVLAVLAALAVSAVLALPVGSFGVLLGLLLLGRADDDLDALGTPRQPEPGDEVRRDLDLRRIGQVELVLQEVARLARAHAGHLLRGYGDAGQRGGAARGV